MDTESHESHSCEFKRGSDYMVVTMTAYEAVNLKYSVYFAKN